MTLYLLQLDMTRRQLTAVTREKDELSKKIALIQERDVHTMTQQHTVQASCKC